MITHTVEQFILDPKLILLSSSYRTQAHTIEQFILDPKSKQDKVKVTNSKNLPKLKIFVKGGGGGGGGYNETKLNIRWETTYKVTYIYLQ